MTQKMTMEGLMLEGQEIAGDATFVVTQTTSSQSAPTTQTAQTTPQPGDCNDQQKGNLKRKLLEEFCTSTVADVVRTKGPGTVDKQALHSRPQDTTPAGQSTSKKHSKCGHHGHH